MEAAAFRTRVTSEEGTRALAAELATTLYASPPAFVRLVGALGAGKSTFARGFITAWLARAGESAPETITSPTYNIARVYGAAPRALAHLDLYRLKSLRELEQLGFEHYFYESSCLVEWLEQVPEALALAPPNAVEVTLEAVEGAPEAREITIRGWQRAS